jgi:hypothetical protein
MILNHTALGFLQLILPLAHLLNMGESGLIKATVEEC